MREKRHTPDPDTLKLERRRFLMSLAMGGGTLVVGTFVGGCRSLLCCLGHDPKRLCVSEFTAALQQIQSGTSPGGISSAWAPALTRLEPTGRIAAVSILEVGQRGSGWADVAGRLGALSGIGVDVDEDEEPAKGDWCGGGCGETAGNKCGFSCAVPNLDDMIFAIDVEGVVINQADFERLDRKALPLALKNATRAYERMFRPRELSG